MFKRKAQSSVELAVLVIIVMGAMLAAGVYFKRGIQGRWKAAVDEIGEQYDPAYMNSQVVHLMASNTETMLYTEPNAAGGYWTMRVDQSNATDSEYGYTRVGTTP